MNTKTKPTRAPKFVLMCALFGVACGPAIAQISQQGPLPFDAIPVEAESPFGGMSISPTRLVMEAGRSGQGVTLYNSGNERVSYRVEIIDLKVSESGAYSELQDGEDAPWSAAQYLRHAPRQVTLNAGERQTVKFISRAPRDTEPGEYRSHIRFSSIPTIDPIDPLSQSDDERDPNAISISVGLDFRVTIPVLLRVGDLSSGAQLSGAKVVTRDGKKEVELSITRLGEMSEYGTLKVFDAESREVGLLRGVSVLSPNRTRDVRIALSDLDARPVSVKYFEQLPGRKMGRLLAEATVLN